MMDIGSTQYLRYWMGTSRDPRELVKTPPRRVPSIWTLPDVSGPPLQHTPWGMSGCSLAFAPLKGESMIQGSGGNTNQPPDSRFPFSRTTSVEVAEVTRPHRSGA